MACPIKPDQVTHDMSHKLVWGNSIPWSFLSIWLTGSDFLVFYHLILTDKCNLSCSYCRGKSAVSDELQEGSCVIDTTLPVELAFDLDHLYSFLARDPHPVLTFYGGEPLMRADLVREILRDAPAEKFMLQTNGLLLHELDPADACRFDTILVSIDGPESLTDQYRGAGTYRKVIEEVQKFDQRASAGNSSQG